MLLSRMPGIIHERIGVIESYVIRQQRVWKLNLLFQMLWQSWLCSCLLCFVSESRRLNVLGNLGGGCSWSGCLLSFCQELVHWSAAEDVRRGRVRRCQEVQQNYSLRLQRIITRDCFDRYFYDIEIMMI